jgi:hypothetical protein
MVLISTCGIAVADLIASDLPQIADVGKVVFTPNPIELRIGGHPCNVSIDLLQMGLAGSEISTIISVGKDVFGEFIQRTLMGKGINSHVYKARAPTSKNLILVVKGEDRRFHIDVGANLFLDPAYVLSILRKDRPSIFYIGATGMLGIFDDELPYVCQEAKSLGSIVFSDIISPYKRNWEYIIPSFKWTDIFHCNAVEASYITGRKDPREAARAIVDMGVKVCLVTMGKKGLVAKIGEVELSMPSFKVQVVDPTGAGDAFSAGILYQLVQEPHYTVIRKNREVLRLNIREWLGILMYASACGAACCKGVGTTASVKPEYIRPLFEEKGKQILKQVNIFSPNNIPK